MQFLLNYYINGAKFTTSSTNDHLDLDVIFENDIYKVEVIPKFKLSGLSCVATFNYNFNLNSRIFANGFQSWTDSREYFINEKMFRLHPISKTFISKSGMARAGDYNFKTYSKKRGVFHGYSYSYVRNGAIFDFIGSLQEETGYTIINFSAKENKITVEKELQGISIDMPYTLLNFAFFSGEENVVFDRYFDCLNISKPTIKHQNGYTSWYNYYGKVTESDIVTDLEAFCKLNKKIDIFQIDDGFQTAVGDWFSIEKDKFPNGMKYIADTIKSKGLKAGLWLAPFGVAINSEIAKTHPEWLVCDAKGKPIIVGLNWNGFYSLDIYQKEVREHLKVLFDVVLKEWGYDMVKLDFLYCCAVEPMYNKTRGQIMCEGMQLIRELVGDKLILGCGVPLAPAFGLVDFCRIGADVGLSWKSSYKDRLTHREDVSTKNTLNNTIFRRQLDGRAFVNDPDVVLLRDYNIGLSLPKRKIISIINKIFGNILFVSDRISKYNSEQMQIFDDLIQDAEIEIVSAEYTHKDWIKVEYKLDGKYNSLTFNVNNGNTL